MEDLKNVSNCEDMPEEELSEAEMPVEENDEIISKLKEALCKAEEERDQFKELAARAQADLINYRNRTDREVKRMRELAGEKSVMELLPVLDNLERVLIVPDGAELSTVIEGIEMVERQFVSALDSIGAKAIASVNETFSPKFHEAIGSVPVEDESFDGVVIDEFQKGYVMGDKVIRPAKVRIGSYCK